MTSTPPKRSASTTPDGSRPVKRQATSSPEEGELDDATPPRVHKSPTPPLKSKIKFPFKKRTAIEPEDARRNGGRELPFERGRDDGRRYREDERRGGRSRSRDRRRETWQSSSRPANSWVPESDRYHNGGRWAPPERGHHPQRARDRSPDERDRSYRPQSPTSYRDRDHDRHRRRPSRSPSSPRSPPSRSPDSSTSPKRKHRLPSPRAATTVKDNPFVDSAYETFRKREDELDQDRRNDGRNEGWRWERRKDKAFGDREVDFYHPTSPGAMTPPRPPISPLSSPRSQKPPKSPDSTVIEPPAESVEATEPVVPVLPPEHPTISIALPPKPEAPAPPRSPPSMPLLKTEPDEKKQEVKYAAATKSYEAPVQRPKRKLVVRTREEEHQAYGRVFVGCGMQADYDVLKKLGEGTFGEVHKAVHKKKGATVALKRILMHNEKEGMPVTALREIKILKALKHPCIIDLMDMFVVRSQGKESPLSVYMVFPYMDHDLAGLLENERVLLSPSQIKLYMKQLLEGTEYMHRNHILHRDMKAANLLISNTGSLKIADFGLARAFDPSIVRNPEAKDITGRVRERKYTNCVVTRWYRPPELLLGARQYGGEVDMWGIGCVLGEMWVRSPILPGSSDLDQVERIWKLCGTPTVHDWPTYDNLPGCEGVKRWQMHMRRVKQTYEFAGTETADLMDRLLTCNPNKRITAAQALDHDYFWTDPLPADPKTLPKYEASHEFDKRGRRQHPPQGPPNPANQMPNAFDLPRQLPAPLNHHPMHRRGPPPPREAFRTGPPPHQPPPPQGYPGAPPSGYPNPQGYPNGPPQGYPNGPPHGYPSAPPQGYSNCPPLGYANGPQQGYPKGHPSGYPNGAPQPGYSNAPAPPGHSYPPQNAFRGPPGPPMPPGPLGQPQMLPPISLRPGQPPPQIAPWQGQPPPFNGPGPGPYPPRPAGRGGGYDRRDRINERGPPGSHDPSMGHGHTELNYG